MVSFFQSLPSFASLLTTTKVSPGGVDTTFCDPPHMISIWHASMFRGSPKEAETESTTVRIPYFFKKRADGRYIVEHATWSIAVYYGCIFVVMVIRKEGFQFLYIESVLIISGIKAPVCLRIWKQNQQSLFRRYHCPEQRTLSPGSVMEAMAASVQDTLTA